MNKKLLIIITLIILITLIIYPNIEFYKDNKLYILTYKEDMSEFENNMCFNESYSYNKDRDISIYKWNSKNLLFFRWLELEFKKGNICDTEYYLDDEYINKIINESEIIENKNNINLKELIKDRIAILDNKKYSTDEEKIFILYKLDNKEEELYLFYIEDLLIIQIGNVDEGAKYIAYEKR